MVWLLRLIRLGLGLGIYSLKSVVNHFLEKSGKVPSFLDQTFSLCLVIGWAPQEVWNNRLL